MNKETDKQKQILQMFATRIINGIYEDISEDQRRSELQQVCAIPLPDDDPELPYIAAQKFFYNKFRLGPHTLTRQDGVARVVVGHATGIKDLPEFSKDLIETIGRQLLQESQS